MDTRTGEIFRRTMTGRLLPDDYDDESERLHAERRLEAELAAYPADERRWIREADALKGKPGHADRLEVLRVTMAVRRKAIWQAAQRSGWGKLERRARYRSLLARTKGST